MDRERLIPLPCTIIWADPQPFCTLPAIGQSLKIPSRMMDEEGRVLYHYTLRGALIEFFDNWLSTNKGFKLPNLKDYSNVINQTTPRNTERQMLTLQMMYLRESFRKGNSMSCDGGAGFILLPKYPPIEGIINYVSRLRIKNSKRMLVVSPDIAQNGEIRPINTILNGWAQTRGIPLSSYMQVEKKYNVNLENITRALDLGLNNFVTRTLSQRAK